MTISKTLRVSGVAIATLGLSTCSDGGAVDPAPPPLDCTTVGKGESLTATGALSGQTLTVTINDSVEASWAGTPTVSNFNGVTSGTAMLESPNVGPVIVTLSLAPGATSGSFQLSGTLQGFGSGPACGVTRIFHFDISGGSVTVAVEDNLPLGVRDRAAILVMRREGREVDLHAAGAPAGAAVGWTATGGVVHQHEAGRVTWRLPEEPGLYQMELLVDRGREGFSVDTLTLEVG